MADALRDHYEEECQPVGYAVGADMVVAAIGAEAVVDEQDHEAGATVGEEGGAAYAHYRLDYLRPPAKNAPLEADERRGPRKMADDDAQGHGLRHEGAYGRAANPQAHLDDEQIVEGYVHAHGRKGGEHGAARVARRTHNVVESQIQVGQDVAVEKHAHVGLGVGERRLGSPEERQYGLDKYERDGGE